MEERLYQESQSELRYKRFNI